MRLRCWRPRETPIDRFKQVRRAPLLGVPLAVKDNYLTKGLTTTFGTSVLASFTPTRDAAAVAAVKDAGAIVFGKNNLVEMSFGLTGLNEHHGQVKNPYNKAHVTGGSSSGAGASVAARIVPAALGGDTVGSIRVPASLCGVVGYKPTPGRWPSDGAAPISHVLDAIGLTNIPALVIPRDKPYEQPPGVSLRLRWKGQLLPGL